MRHQVARGGRRWTAQTDLTGAGCRCWRELLQLPGYSLRLGHQLSLPPTSKCCHWSDEYLCLELSEILHDSTAGDFDE